MNTLNAIKARVRTLYRTNPNIHMNVTIPGGRIHLKKHPVTITSVYPNIFSVEDRTTDPASTHIVQYVELMMGYVEILELTQK